MKINLFGYFAFLFPITFVNAQQNEFRFQLNNIFHYNSDELIELHESTQNQLLIIEEDNTSNIDFNFIYLRRIKKINWLIGLGLNRINQDGKDLIPQDTSYTSRIHKWNKDSYNFKFGIQYPISFKDYSNVSLHLGLIGLFRRDKFFNVEYRTNVYDNQDNYLQGASLEYIYPRSWRTGIQFNFGLYYYFFEKIGLGVELSNLIYLNRSKGITKRIQQFYDKEEKVIDRLEVNQKDDKILFGKSATLFSISISYKFNFKKR